MNYSVSFAILIQRRQSKWKTLGFFRFILFFPFRHESVHTHTISLVSVWKRGHIYFGQSSPTIQRAQSNFICWARSLQSHHAKVNPETKRKRWSKVSMLTRFRACVYIYRYVHFRTFLSPKLKWEKRRNKEMKNRRK